MRAMVRVGGIDDAVWTQPSGAVAPGGRTTRKQRITVIAFLVVVGVGVVYPIGAAAFSRKDYGTFAFWNVPSRIGYCGRTYDDGGSEQGSPALFASHDSEAGAHWSRLSWTFSGRSIYAATATPSPPTITVCTMVLYMPLGGGRWETYPLSGGP
jgi:hypothetical protein